MPELPEVEVTRQGLLPHLLQRTVTAVHCSGQQLRLPVPEKEIHQWVQGHTITAVERRAKYLLIRLHNKSVLVIHLGMTGRLGIFSQKAAKAKHDHLCLTLNNAMELRFNDTRRFGSVAVWPPAGAKNLEEAFTRRCGIEPLSDRFTARALANLARRRSTPIKNFLMDSKTIAGIGNIYANEILFAAGIHPKTKACQLNDRQWQAIVTCCPRILHRAIEAGGSTIADFLGSSGQPGYFQLQLAVYGKKGEKCPRCRETIDKAIIGGRATFFCSACQPL